MDGGTKREYPQPQHRALGQSPSLRALQCEIEWRSGRRAPARAACEAALVAYGECLPALQAASAIAIEEGALSRAERHLRKALLLAPDVRRTWQSLEAVLRAQGRARELAEFQQGERQWFGDESRP